ncbi:MAG TPA: protein kinase [Gemmatimonadaceae bacterium]|nr:protein kinase [Gemmatimonadaceae bacterium]
MSNDDVLARLTTALADRYRIDRELGAGGMATVYLAHDIRHDRDVAIKVLHPDLGAALGGERFLTEIRTTARLQHPHILPLLDSGNADGLLYYVMPLVAGETLRARLTRERQLPIDDAIRISREIADALDYAHRQGVIHRDIKPENVMLHEGRPMVMDFGIALAVQQAGGQRMTQTGLSLGTPQYMSPEQAMGERSIDARSDLWALAAVTYEMLVGEAPFTGPSVQTILARVMTEEPRPLATQRKAIPESVEHAVMRALEKLPADRWSSAREFTAALDGGGPPSIHAGNSRAGRRTTPAPLSWNARLRDPLVLTLAAVAFASLVLAAWTRRGPSRAAADVVRFTIPAPLSERANSLGVGMLAISPDGRTLAYVGLGTDGQQHLMLRSLDEIAAHPLPETTDATNPVFSPDGRWVAFLRGNQIFKVATDGSRPQLLGPAPGLFGGMSWSSTGVIIVSGNTELYTIPEAGGPPRDLLKPNRAAGDFTVGAPVAVDAEGIVLYSMQSNTSMASAKIAMVSLKTGEHVVLDAVGPQPLGIEKGVLTYVTLGGLIMGVPIDVRAKKLAGTPVQLASDVAINSTTGLARAALALNGTLFYQSGTQSSQVMSVSSDGSARTLMAEAREYAFPRMSPDGRRLAVAVGESGRRDIWLFELSSQTFSRLTSEGAANDRPEWSPDGNRVLYRTDRGARSAIWWHPADLSADAAQLIGGDKIDVWEAVISPDARNIVYQLDTTGADIYYRNVSGDTTPHVVSNASKAIETMPRVSPDGRWVAFTTDESGRQEVVVQPFPAPGGRVQVSTRGGSEPVWSPDGKRLFYRGDGRLMAARLNTTAGFAVVARDTLFADTYQFAGNPHANYDVTADGSHFVFLKAASEGSMIVVTNWTSVVRSRMAAAAK